jgi:hypothetical protein
MAVIEELKALFERDIRFATWDDNVQVDSPDSNSTNVRFYTDNNEYILTFSVVPPEEEPYLSVTVRARKPRAGQAVARARAVLPPGHDRLNARTWRRLIGIILGLELVRIQRRDPIANVDLERAPPAPSEDIPQRKSLRSA